MKTSLIHENSGYARKLLVLAGILIVGTGGPVKAERATNMMQASRRFIDLGKEAEESLVRTATSIKIGSTVEFVVKMLGTPTIDKKLISKRGVFVVRRFRYYTTKLTKDSVNEKQDRYLTMDFDASDRLIAKRQKLDGGEQRPL